MKLIDKILIQKLGFSTTTHDRCIYTKRESSKITLILRQVDDFLIRCNNSNSAEALTKEIGRLVMLKHEDLLPI